MTEGPESGRTPGGWPEVRPAPPAGPAIGWPDLPGWTEPPPNDPGSALPASAADPPSTTVTTPAPGDAPPAPSGVGTTRSPQGFGVTVTAAGGGAVPAARSSRRARLQLRRVDPWSTLRFSFVASLALLVVLLVAVIVLYAVLSGMHVFSTINDQLRSLTDNGAQDTSTGLRFDFSFARVMGISLLLGAVNVVLFTALATLGAFVYNLVADLVGGIEITLAESD